MKKYLSPELTIDELYDAALICTSSVDGLDVIDGTDITDVSDQFNF